MTFSSRLFIPLCLVLAAQASTAQPQGATGRGTPDDPFVIEPDARAIQRTYYYDEAGKDMPFAMYVSSKVMPDKPAPLIIALHGMGGDGNFLIRNNLIDLAEAGGYIVAAPMGYHVAGWYGSPVIAFPRGAEIKPPNLAELSEGDVMNVLAMMREEFNVDPDRTYLMGHSMGGAGTLFLGQKYASDWAAIAAIAPAAFMMQPNRGEILHPIQDTGVPVMVIQGDEDTAVPVENTRMWATTMDEMGMAHEYIEIPGGDHGTVIPDGMPDIFRFFAEHGRQ